MTLLEEFKIRFPEFLNPPPGQTAATEDQIIYWIEQAELFLCPSAWGKFYRMAVLTLAAAYLSMMLKQSMNGPASGESGPVASASVGGESVSYGINSKFGAGTSTDDWMWLVPPYGPAYLMLRDSVMSGVEMTRTFAPFTSMDCGEGIGG